MRSPRSFLRPAAVALAVALLCSACTATPGESADAGWSQLEAMPLSARTHPTLAWSGSEVFVVGGDTGPVCPSTADCVAPAFARDGAAFDPVFGTWRDIRDAPMGIPPSNAVFAKGRLFIAVPSAQGGSDVVSYGIAADQWTTLHAPDDVSRTLVADGDRVLFIVDSDELGPSDDLALDVESEEWSTLSADPLGSSFDRVITVTPDSLVLTAKELVGDPGGDKPPLTIAARYDRTTDAWTRLPDTGQIGGLRWMWTGSRLVSPELGGGDGGETDNWGRMYPNGGTLALPDGTWSALSDPPEPLQDAWVSDTVGPARFALSGGYAYDDVRNSWTAVGKPSGAPQEAGVAIWADERLLVFGGVDWTDAGAAVSDVTWMYTPRG